MLEGRIIKGIGGFYYVKTNKGTYECRARGLFREEKIKPMIGDIVKIRLSEGNTGYIEEIMKRKNYLLRPAVSNVDQIMVIMSIKSPDLNLWLLDRFLVMSEYQKIETVIIFSKTDLLNQEEFEKFSSIYKKAGYEVIGLSTKTGEGLKEVEKALVGKTTVLAGPSGVGKSSLLNNINEDFSLETGEISKKTSRGKHTTRHVELMELPNNTYVLDTPGFSSLKIDFIKNSEDLTYYFKEFNNLNITCKFTGCLHHREPGCIIKKRVDENLISNERYINYLDFLEELKNIRRY